MSAIGGQIGTGLSRSGSSDTSDEGPDTGPPTTPPVLKYRAFGGPVSAGEMYRVNEGNLPEFFRPAMSGEVIPLWRMGDYNGGNSYDFSSTTNNNFAPPGEMKVRHSGSIELREPPSRAPVSYRQRAGQQEIKDKIISWLFK